MKLFYGQHVMGEHGHVRQQGRSVEGTLNALHEFMHVLPQYVDGLRIHTRSADHSRQAH